MKRCEFVQRSATAALGLGLSAGLGACAASARSAPGSPTGPAPAALVRALPKVELHAHLEGTVRPSTFAELARKNDIALQVNDVNELFAVKNLDELGCERIDHGVRLLEDEALTEQVVAERIPLTVCPLSNVLIANVVPDVAHHPIVAQRARGVLATVNSDDPAMTATSVADNYVAVAGAFGWTVEQMEQISLDGIEACWAPDDERQALVTRFEGEFEELRRQYRLPART